MVENGGWYNTMVKVPLPWRRMGGQDRGTVIRAVLIVDVLIVEVTKLQ